MTYQKKIDAEYQAEIDAFIAKNGVKQLSNTDNQLGEARNFRAISDGEVERIRRKQDAEKSAINEFKNSLNANDVVKTADYEKMGFKNKKSIAVCVTAMRKAGWEIETIHRVGYRLIKVGGYVRW